MRTSQARRIREGIDRARRDRAASPLPSAIYHHGDDPLTARAYQRTVERFWPELYRVQPVVLPTVPGRESAENGDNRG